MLARINDAANVKQIELLANEALGVPNLVMVDAFVTKIAMGLF